MKLSNIIIILVAILLSACLKQNVENVIVGEWVIDSVSTSIQIQEKYVEEYNILMNDFKSATKFVFNDDKTYRFVYDDKEEIGNWKINKGKNTLILNNISQTKEDAKRIDVISKNRIQFTDSKHGDITRLFLERKQ